MFVGSCRPSGVLAVPPVAPGCDGGRSSVRSSHPGSRLSSTSRVSCARVSATGIRLLQLHWSLSCYICCKLFNHTSVNITVHCPNTCSAHCLTTVCPILLNNYLVGCMSFQAYSKHYSDVQSTLPFVSGQILHALTSKMYSSYFQSLFSQAHHFLHISIRYGI